MSLLDFGEEPTAQAPESDGAPAQAQGNADPFGDDPFGDDPFGGGAAQKSDDPFAGSGGDAFDPFSAPPQCDDQVDTDRSREAKDPEISKILVY